MSDFTPTDALATALTVMGAEPREDIPDTAAAILAALPDDAHLFTPDSLAAAMDKHRQSVRREWQKAHRDDPTYGDITHLCDAGECPAAIIQAAKEAERES